MIIPHQNNTTNDKTVEIKQGSWILPAVLLDRWYVCGYCGGKIMKVTLVEGIIIDQSLEIGTIKCLNRTPDNKFCKTINKIII